MREQFQPHLAQLSGENGPQHYFIVPAFVDDEVRLYSIDLILSSDRKKYAYSYTQHVRHRPKGPSRPPRLAFAGSA